MGFGEYGTGTYLYSSGVAFMGTGTDPDPSRGKKCFNFFFFLYTEIIFCIQKVNLEYKMPYGTVVL